jgi:hypothetical protein
MVIMVFQDVYRVFVIIMVRIKRLKIRKNELQFISRFNAASM